MTNRARDMLAEAVNLPAEDLADDAAIGTVEGWDSLAHIRLITAIERFLGRELTTDEAISINSLASLGRVLDEAAKG